MAPIGSSMSVDDAIIDGEVIAADETGRPQFYDLLRGTRAPAYVAFDIVWLNGADLRSLPSSGSRAIIHQFRITELTVGTYAPGVSALGGYLTLQHQAVEIPPLVHVVVGIGLVHDAAVVPDHHVATLPLVPVFIFGCVACAISSATSSSPSSSAMPTIDSIRTGLR
jgi:hypothetical protein